MDTAPPLPLMPPPAPKTRVLPWVLGGCGCLTLIVAAVFAGLFFIGRGAVTEMKRQATEDHSGWAGFTNSLATTPAGLRDHYVDFSFAYPKGDYQILPDEQNFVMIEKGVSGTFTLSNLSVGAIIMPAKMTDDVGYPQVIKVLTPGITKVVPGFEIVQESPDKLDGCDARSMTFKGLVKGTEKGDLSINGKLLIARRPGQENGVALLMMVTSLDADFKTPAEVGSTGSLGGMVKSFSFK